MMIKRTQKLLLASLLGVVMAAPEAGAQDRQVEAKPARATIQQSGDLTLKRGLLAKPENTVEESRLLLEQMKTASAELTHVIQQRPGRTVVAQLRMMQSQLDEAIDKWEEKLASIGDDAQLANIELQNMMQKQQQTLQTMSNVSKMHHDTAMAIIRKIG